MDINQVDASDRVAELASLTAQLKAQARQIGGNGTLATSDRYINSFGELPDKISGPVIREEAVRRHIQAYGDIPNSLLIEEVLDDCVQLILSVEARKQHFDELAA